jgi:hypothetical protein
MRALTHLNLANNPRLSDGGAATSIQEIAVAGQLGADILPLIKAPVNRGGLALLDRLVSLDLSCTAVSTSTLRSGIAAPDLRQLSLNQCTKVEDGGLYQLAAHHPRLERLELRSCLLTDTGLVSGLSCLPRLVHLDLSSCNNISSTGTASQSSSCEIWSEPSQNKRKKHTHKGTGKVVILEISVGGLVGVYRHWISGG